MEKRKRGAKNGTFETLGGYWGGGLPKYHTFAISLLKFRVGISKKWMTVLIFTMKETSPLEGSS